ncbi:ribonuclease H-like domain-containing protein [Tanacetum coccineum]|uniref:Ribonuclease H-like domain-containing protein n=1 Tax=Tanacetum coccineum TaxID=301880 RepID=A0ABQ5GY32_9ASTR
MSGISKPKNPISLAAITSPCLIPRNPKDALSNPNWKNAMIDEYNALIENKTWVLVPRTSDMHVIRSMWIFRHKMRSDGSFERYKARLVGDGRSQQVGVDCDDTFSPVVKPATIRTVLSLAVSKSWLFINWMSKTLSYMKSLYGLKQAPRAWYQRFVDFVHTIGFVHSQSDHSLFVYRKGRDLAYLLLYVDDIILTTSSDALRHSLIDFLAQEFAMKDLGPLNYFLGIAVKRHQHGLFLSQSQYASDILERAALKRILRYVQGTLHYGLHLYKSPSSALVSYTDADWGGCPDTRRSTSGYCVYLGDNLISWSSKRQPTLSRSSAEAEYRGVANVVSESCWLRNLLLEQHCPLQNATLVYCDNIADIFTKGLPRVLFDDFRDNLSIRPPPASIPGVY